MTINNYEHTMSVAGVPPEYWYLETIDNKPSTIQSKNKRTNKVKIVTIKTQLEILNRYLYKNEEGKYEIPKYTIISSVPNDSVALKVISKIISNYVENYTFNNIRLLDCANVKEGLDLQSIGFCVIHNLFSDSNSFRLQSARDLILKLRCPIIVVIGGSENPIHFAKTKLNLYFQGAMLFMGGINL
jgi:hypothetical protein